MGRQRTMDKIPSLPHFQAWLRSQGHSEAEQAKHIGVSARCVTYWKTGQRWPTISVLRHCPDALRALADDLEERHGRC